MRLRIDGGAGGGGTVGDSGTVRSPEVTRALTELLGNLKDKQDAFIDVTAAYEHGKAAADKEDMRHLAEIIEAAGVHD